MLALLVVSSIFSGCQTINPKLKTQDEAGAVLLSVNSIVRWDEVNSVLAPNFKMDGDTAISKVAPVTADALEQSLQSTNFSLGLGLPQSSTSSTATTTNTGTTTSNTQSHQAGIAPSPPTGSSTGAQLPPGSLSSGSFGLDPMLAYKAANSLNQYVQLLNTEVNHVFEADNNEYIPYVVHTTITFMPYRHDLPYDLHTLISFFVSSDLCHFKETLLEKCPPSKNPKVIPFLVTDDVEKALTTRSSETARNIAIALGALTNGVATNAGYDNLTKALKTISSQDINSRLTVARESENTIYVRIGATYEAKDEFSLVGQTYDVFVLLLVPKLPNPTQTIEIKKRSIHVLSDTQFRYAEDGSELLPRAPDSLLKGTDAMMKNIFSLHKNILKRWENADDQKKIAFILLLTGDIQQDDYLKFSDDLKCGNVNPLCEQPDIKAISPADSATSPSPSEQSDIKENKTIEGVLQVYSTSIWTAFSRLLADSSFKSVIFDLPEPKFYVIPKQTALIVDDKKSATITLSNIEGNPTGCISASLLINKAGQIARRLVALGLNTDTALGTLSLTFDSPAALQMPIGEWTAQLEINKRAESNKIASSSTSSSADNTPLMLKPTDTDRQHNLIDYLCDINSSINGGTANRSLFDAIPVPDAPKDKSSVSSIDSFAKNIVIKENGTGSIGVSFKLNGSNKLNFTVKGAELLSVVDDVKKRIVVTKNGFVVTHNGSVVLQLGNLINGTTVTIDATPDKTGSKMDPLGSISRLSFVAVSN